MIIHKPTHTRVYVTRISTPIDINGVSQIYLYKKIIHIPIIMCIYIRVYKYIYIYIYIFIYIPAPVGNI